MTGLDPTIMEKHIDNWPDAPPIRQKQCSMHPTKATTIEDKVDKLHGVEFIIPFKYTSWVYNLVPITKKHGNICICKEFHDLNLEYPKYNYPTPFIDQIINSCIRHEVLSLMDVFSNYNQI